MSKQLQRYDIPDGTELTRTDRGGFYLANEVEKYVNWLQIEHNKELAIKESEKLLDYDEVIKYLKEIRKDVKHRKKFNKKELKSMFKTGEIHCWVDVAKEVEYESKLESLFNDIIIAIKDMKNG